MVSRMISLFHGRGLGTRIGLGYVAVGLILVGALGTTIWQARRTAAITHQLVEVRTPSTLASLEMLNGVNSSLAALSEWTILGKEASKQERANAWSEWIDPSLAAMKQLAADWTDSKNVERLEAIVSKLADLRRFQKEIEDIAWTAENAPATEVLLRQAAPKAQVLATNITRMIDLELEQAATPERKALLGMMADVRGTLGLSLGALRAYLLSGDSSFKQRFDELWAKNSVRFGDLSARVDLLTPEQRRAYELFASLREQFEPLPRRMFELREGEERNLARCWMGARMAPTALDIKKNVEAMMASQRQLTATDMAEAKRLTTLHTKVAWFLLVTGVLLCAVLGTILGTIVTRSITRPLGRMVDAATAMAQGDLTVRVPTSDPSEIGTLARAMNQMATSLSTLVARINEHGDRMGSAIREQAEGARSQSVATDEMSTTVTELLTAAKAMAENAGSVAEQAMLASEECSSGTTSVAGAVKGINGINERVERIAAHMVELSSNSQQINGVLDIVTELSEQTNLLSLNASIEAAGAGDAGKRFAVVASEIRRLAERAADSTGEIRALIDGVQETVNAAIMATEEGTKAVQEGVRLTGEVDKSFGRIAEQVASTRQSAKSIEMSSRQQATAIEQMECAVQHVDTAAQQTAETIRQLDAGTQTLLETAGKLRGTKQEARET